jgi:hypothetical protein
MEGMKQRAKVEEYPADQDIGEALIRGVGTRGRWEGAKGFAKYIPGSYPAHNPLRRYEKLPCEESCYLVRKLRE